MSPFNLTLEQARTLATLAQPEGTVEVEGIVAKGLVGPVGVRLDDGTRLLVLANGDVVSAREAA